jgi:hypothetical protein
VCRCGALLINEDAWQGHTSGRPDALCMNSDINTPPGRRHTKCMKSLSICCIFPTLFQLTGRNSGHHNKTAIITPKCSSHAHDHPTISNWKFIFRSNKFWEELFAYVSFDTTRIGQKRKKKLRGAHIHTDRTSRLPHFLDNRLTDGGEG